MPYIKQELRDALDGIIRRDKLKALSLTPGELNYVITQLLLDYMGHDISYTKINEIIGVMECAKQEFYTRIARPYEDKKCIENGEVY